MATSQPISSISYNTEDFLKARLDEWYKAHLIQAYMYISHIGEDGDKNHIHFRIEPNKVLDPMDLQSALKEIDPNNDKPLGCRPFRHSKEEDWFLYVVHDSTYLKLKYGGGEKGEKIPYEYTKIVVSPDYDLDIAFIRAKSYLEHTSVSLANKMKSGTKPFDLVLQGEDVYLVNALAKSVSQNDYFRLFDDYNLLNENFCYLLKYLDDSLLLPVYDDDGHIINLKEKTYEKLI